MGGSHRDKDEVSINKTRKVGSITSLLAKLQLFQLKYASSIYKP